MSARAAAQPPPPVERASATDRPAIESLLGACGLPTAGLDDARLWVAREPEGSGLRGVVGLEVRGRAGLLRSLAVAPAHRGSGLGRELVAVVEHAARVLGLAELDLLTSTAAPLFRRLGWRDAERTSAPTSFATSAEWSENVCPASAIFLRKVLEDGSGATAS